MAKIDPLTDPLSTQTTPSAIASNNDKIATAFENTLSRDGSTPNAMGANLDMNGYQILNSGGIVLTDSPTFNGTVTGDDGVFDSITLSNVSGEGIKVDTTTPAFGWRDIIGTPQQPTTGSGKPSWTQIASSGVYSWNYALNDEQWYTYHIPHDYVPGTDIHFHVHWFSSTTAGGYTKWQFDYLYSQGHAQAAFPTTATTVYATQQQDTTAYTHMIAETDGVTVANLEVDGLLVIHVKRIDPTPQTDVVGGVFVPVVDIHYQSTNLATKNKSPDFWS